MSEAIKLIHPITVEGLGAWTHTTLTTSMYTCHVRSTDISTSGLSITIVQSGSNSVTYTSTAPTTTQRHIEIAGTFMCVAGDVITITTSSSTLNDKLMNTVKTTINLRAGF